MGYAVILGLCVGNFGYEYFNDYPDYIEAFKISFFQLLAIFTYYMVTGRN